MSHRLPPAIHFLLSHSDLSLAFTYSLLQRFRTIKLFYKTKTCEDKDLVSLKFDEQLE